MIIDTTYNISIASVKEAIFYEYRVNKEKFAYEDVNSFIAGIVEFINKTENRDMLNLSCIVGFSLFEDYGKSPVFNFLENNPVFITKEGAYINFDIFFPLKVSDGNPFRYGLIFVFNYLCITGKDKETIFAFLYFNKNQYSNKKGHLGFYQNFEDYIDFILISLSTYSGIDLMCKYWSEFKDWSKEDRGAKLSQKEIYKESLIDYRLRIDGDEGVYIIRPDRINDFRKWENHLINEGELTIGLKRTNKGKKQEFAGKVYEDLYLKGILKFDPHDLRKRKDAIQPLARRYNVPSLVNDVRNYIKKINP